MINEPPLFISESVVRCVLRTKPASPSPSPSPLCSKMTWAESVGRESGNRARSESIETSHIALPTRPEQPNCHIFFSFLFFRRNYDNNTPCSVHSPELIVRESALNSRKLECRSTLTGPQRDRWDFVCFR